MTVADLITEALWELNVVDPAETPSADLAALGLTKLNRLLDSWNAERLAVYSDQFAVYTLTPSVQPHTIGPSGATWTITPRPVSVEGATVVVSGAEPTGRRPLHLRDAQWWQHQRAPTVTGPYPTDVYYDPTWPNGSLYFWPVPTTAATVQLWIRLALGQVSATDTWSLPPGYREAVTLSLAEALAAPLGRTWTAAQALQAREARERVFRVNVQTPRLVTADAGMPHGRRGRPNFFWWTGEVL